MSLNSQEIAQYSEETARITNVLGEGYTFHIDNGLIVHYMATIDSFSTEKEFLV